MSTIEQPLNVDAEKLMQFVFRAVDEVGATLNAALIVMGDKLGLYKDVVEQACFSRFQRVAETPFILVFEARP